MTRPLILTMGEPAGIGTEITLKSWKDHRASLPVFALMDSPVRLTQLANDLGWTIPVCEITDLGQACAIFQEALPVLSHPVGPVSPGRMSVDNAPHVISSIKRAVTLVQSGSASALVTNPINKHILKESGFEFPGHTEFLAHLAGIDHPPIMMLASETLKVVPLTIHMSVQEALNTLSEDLIIEKCHLISEGLKAHFGLDHPHLALAGLNPHAGENGTMGTEEIHMIIPALEKMQQQGLNVTGPYPPDTLFHARARQAYDVAVCMYHDQALIPIKTIAFDEGVNVTLGLPFIRTSPDHGTALDIAGTGLADPTSLICALQKADDMYALSKGRTR